MTQVLNSFKPEWISEPGKFDRDTVEFAEKFGKLLCDLHNDRPSKNALTTSQIRNFFGEVRRIEAKVQQGGFEKNKTAFLLIKPKLAYAEARVTSKTKGSKIIDFRNVMDKAFDAVLNSKNRDEAFKRFVEFMEAVLAFHKAYGGRD